ncbi:hypothetical protein HDU67_010379 [Dinochytrium kinnereticum]|nr:hypothetical protein HDU67_010379 [Dinochytrium kinnereticum]
MDMALDDIIKVTPKENGGGRGKRGGGGGKPFGRRGLVGSGNWNRNSGPAPYNVPKRSADEPWRHDMFEGADLRERLSTGPTRVTKNGRGGWRGAGSSSGLTRDQFMSSGFSSSRVASSALRAAVGGPSMGRTNDTVSIVGSAGGASKITVSNLDSQATAEDVKEVFKEFGRIQKCTLSIDNHGNGFAEIVFDNRRSSLAAIEKYHNQIADGKTLKVVEVNLGLSIAGASKSLVPDAARAAGPVGVGGGLYSDRMAAGNFAAPVANRPLSERLGKRPENGGGGPTFHITI